MTPKKAVLFVCLGNICRSPLAEGLFRHHVERAGLTDRFHIDSAGTGAYHAGEPPDERSIEVALRHGIDLRAQRARKVTEADLETFDEILAMDQSNLAGLKRLAYPGQRARLGLLLDETGGGEVPDPYYGGPRGFDNVYAMVDRACEALLTRLKKAL